MPLSHRLNLFENFQGHADIIYGGLQSNNMLHIHAVNIPGSISFNNMAMIISGSAANGETLTGSLSFGLYSLNASTLSLANSGSFSTTFNNAGSNMWATFVTSAVQDITPGTWFLAGMSNTSKAGALGVTFQVMKNNTFLMPSVLIYGGPFFRGYYTATQTSMPASIATSDLNKDGPGSFGPQHPYILIGS